jgi:hypothetical protein
MESRAYLAWNDPIRWGAYLIEADSICSKHQSKAHSCGTSLREKFTNKHGSPRTIHSAIQIAPQINTEDRRANNHCDADDEPLRQVGVNNRIERNGP